MRRVPLSLLMLLVAFAPDVAVAQPSASVWESRDGCLQAISTSSQVVPRDVIRVGSWNLRWFPRGCSQRDGCQNPPDLDWIACAVATLDLDVLAVQEVVDYPSDRAAVSHFVRSLERITGQSWRFDLQDCGPPNSQHVGYLWRPDRVRLSGFADIAALNGAARHEGEPCAGSLRPGRYAYVESLIGGVDFHLVTVHLDSGVRAKDWNTRRAAINALPDLLASSALSRRRDTDVVVIGDFNVMGRTQGRRITAEAELALVDETVGPLFNRLRSNPSCSYRYRGRPLLMDLVLISSAMVESSTTAEPSGWCALAGCRALGPDDPASTALSDHCPVILEVRDVDLD
jgi:endonuclease/exonuclease/phosphatase family metal-dependent hydrolase